MLHRSSHAAPRAGERAEVAAHRLPGVPAGRRAVVFTSYPVDLMSDVDHATLIGGEVGARCGDGPPVLGPSVLGPPVLGPPVLGPVGG